MATHYESICEENRRRYGTEGALKSGGLAARLYDDRTHFIFELLQNAEDALARRPAGTHLRTVAFELRSDCLTLSHYVNLLTKQMCAVSAILQKVQNIPPRLVALA